MDKTDEVIERLLISADLVTVHELARAQGIAVETGEHLDVVLCRLGMVEEREIARVLAHALDIPIVDTRDYPPRPVLGDIISVEFLQNAQILPVAEDENAVTVAMADPRDRETIHSVELRLGKTLKPRVALPSELNRQIARLYGLDGEDDQESWRPSASTVDHMDIERLRELSSDSPVVRSVNHMIVDAVAKRASDIHIEAYSGELRIRQRIDGSLQFAQSPRRELHLGIVSRLKIMANLNIMERRLPQDGRFRTHVEGRPIDIRVSTLPAMHGESVALRILDRTHAPLRLDALGMSGSILSTFHRLIGHGSGIVLVTGPTGSGKTTTLYAALQHLNTFDRNLITIEDPIEYELAGIRQIQIHSQIGLGFANILRSVLRHDPDVIMVGEIRDLETARIAVQAALTGHLVLSTLHTNDALSAIVRLRDMGVEDYLISSVVRGVVGQRLVRTLCKTCRAPGDGRADAMMALGFEGAPDQPGRDMFTAVGCSDCAGTGYVGRTSAVEILEIGRHLRDAIMSGGDTTGIARAAAIEGGYEALRVDALRKVASGVTTVDEVYRVTGLE